MFVPGAVSPGITTVPSPAVTSSWRATASAPGGTGAPVKDTQRLTRSELRQFLTAGRGSPDHTECAGHVRCAVGVTVERALIEGRHREMRTAVLRQHTPERLCEGDTLRSRPYRDAVQKLKRGTQFHMTQHAPSFSLIARSQSRTSG